MNDPGMVRLKEKVAGEITLSDEPGKTIRKWREEFGVSQQQLARYLEMSPSVVSDYESGRRRSPGIQTIKKIVEGLIAIDELNGSETIRRYQLGQKSKAILAIEEFSHPVPMTEFLAAVNGENLTKGVSLGRDLHGYTVIDSVEAIRRMNAYDFLQLYGWSTQRALLFTGVQYGRSAMIALRAHPLKPACVVYVRPRGVDELAVELATLDSIPLIRTDAESIDIIRSLQRLRSKQ